MYRNAKNQKKGQWACCTKCHRALDASTGAYFIGTIHGSGGANHCGGTFQWTDDRPSDAW